VRWCPEGKRPSRVGDGEPGYCTQRGRASNDCTWVRSAFSRRIEGGVTLGRSQGEGGRWPGESLPGSPATALPGGRGGEGEECIVTLGRSQGEGGGVAGPVSTANQPHLLPGGRGGEEEEESNG
jgi:hypothetical protein